MAPGFAVALHLLGHITQRVACALAVELVDSDKLGKVQHVDFFELASRTKLRRHHVQGHIDQRHDSGVALANARGLHHDQVKSCGLASGNHIGQSLADFRAKFTRGQRAHKYARRILARGPGRYGVHPDAVAQQRAAALAARGVDRNNRDVQAIAQIQAEAPNKFVGERRFTRAAGAGDADGGHLGCHGLAANSLQQVGRHFAGFDGCHQLRQRAPGGIAMALDGC